MTPVPRIMDNDAHDSAADGSAIGDLAENRLRRSAYLSLQHVTCEFHQGVLTLRGRLPSYYLKQIAQVVVAAVDGVERIDNRIEVMAGIRRMPDRVIGGG